jgi:S-adenosylmethionine decarboxylase
MPYPQDFEQSNKNYRGLRYSCLGISKYWLFLTSTKRFMKYNPGLHVLSEFTSDRNDLLSAFAPCRKLFDKLVAANQLEKVGEVYHDFEDGGFTAVICLTESHLSIHTWPEFGLATFDVFLSNYKKDNTQKAQTIYNDVLAFFEGIELQRNEIVR